MIYSKQDENGKRYIPSRCNVPKGIIKNYNNIINGKNGYDKPIDSNMKRYKEIRKFTTGKRGDYTAGYFSDYYNIKICHRLIVAYLSRQK